MENSAGPKRRVALFDICQTLVGLTTITDFTDNFLLSSKINSEFNRTKWFTHALYKFLRYRLRAVSSAAYRRHLIRLFEDHSESVIHRIAEAYNQRLRDAFKPEVVDKLRELQRAGYEISLVSAGLDVYLRPFAASLNAKLICTVLAKDAHGIYTGRVDGIDCLGEGKVAKVKREMGGFETVDWEDSSAFGDSASDIPILSMVGNAWAVDPDRVLESHARAEGWRILRTRAKAEGAVQS